MPAPPSLDTVEPDRQRGKDAKSDEDQERPFDAVAEEELGVAPLTTGHAGLTRQGERLSVDPSLQLESLDRPQAVVAFVLSSGRQIVGATCTRDAAEACDANEEGVDGGGRGRLRCVLVWIRTPPSLPSGGEPFVRNCQFIQSRRSESTFSTKKNKSLVPFAWKMSCNTPRC